MSIVRVGLAETKKFADGYEAIFGKKKATESQEAESASASASGDKGSSKKKKPKKKK